MSETINNTLTRLEAFLVANYPTADVGPGSVIRELVLKLEASVQNEQYNVISSLDQGKALSQIAANGPGTTTQVLDNIASNYSVTRATGKAATGKIKVTMAEPTTALLPSGFSFYQPALGLRYIVPVETHVTRDSVASTSYNEIPTYSTGSSYFFIVDVVAETAGMQYNVPANTVFNLDTNSFIYNFIGAQAYGSFTGGLPADDDLALLKKIKVDFGSDRLDSPAGIQTKLSQTYTGFQSLSACGANDAEMTRSKQNALGIATLGMADIYVRTSASALVTPFRHTAVKVAADLWEIIVNSATAPGFYKVTSILPVIDGSLLGGTLVVTDVQYSWTPNINARNNVITSDIDARFSRYQNATVRFSYTEVPTADVGSTMEVDVFLSYLPNIADIQDMFLADDSRILCADYLVKAALPCFVSLDITLVGKQSGVSAIPVDTVSLKHDIFNYVNTIPFGETLEASRIIDICHNYNIRRVDLPISMSGVILCNDGSVKYIDNTDELVIPTDLAKGVSPKTTQYFIDYYQSASNSQQLVDSIGIALT